MLFCSGGDAVAAPALRMIPQPEFHLAAEREGILPDSQVKSL